MAQVSSGRVRALPQWVAQRVPVVAATEHYLLEVFGQTESPQALGSRCALAWVGGIQDMAPLTDLPDSPLAWRRAATEFSVAQMLSAGEPYPPAQWWAGEAPGVQAGISRERWESLAEYGWSTSHAHGVALALGWALGLIEEPTMMTPFRRGDGSEIDDDERLVYARGLHKVAVASAT